MQDRYGRHLVVGRQQPYVYYIYYIYPSMEESSSTSYVTASKTTGRINCGKQRKIFVRIRKQNGIHAVNASMHNILQVSRMVPAK